MKSLLAMIAFARTYAAVKKDGKKETYTEVVDRYRRYILKHTPVGLHGVVSQSIDCVEKMKLLPSMRLLQFAGEAAEKEPLRGYNCSYQAIDSVKCFSDILYLSSCGVGCGFSVQSHHIQQLPEITEGKDAEFVILDTRESWADSVALLYHNPKLRFDYSLIRAAGSPLSTGGFASGPEPLRECHETIRAELLKSVGRKPKSIEVYSMVCAIGHCIVSGGVRRSALICLFDANDDDMLSAKSGNWWEKNPHFARSNNSAVLIRDEVTDAQFRKVFDACVASGCGEPGFFFSNNRDMGTNPCSEVSLKSRQLCNLTEVVATNCENWEEFKQAVFAAVVLGTVQASFTNFKYIHPDWKKTCEEDALLGVSITGMADKWDEFMRHPEFPQLASFVQEINRQVAAELGINSSARINTVKPSGTTSTVMDCASGIHANHAEYYIRRIRVSKLDPIAKYLVSVLPEKFVAYSDLEPADVIFSFPVHRTGINRHQETMLELLERVRYVKNTWINPGHVRGDNTHNISVTVNFSPNEVETLFKWLWHNRHNYNGISLLPKFDASYQHMPYEDINKEQYEVLSAELESAQVNLEDILYTVEQDGRANSISCEGPLCEIK